MRKNCIEILETPILENFQGVDITQIKSFEPRQGDSSTVITITENGLDYIGEVLFNGRECLIFDDRKRWRN